MQQTAIGRCHICRRWVGVAYCGRCHHWLCDPCRFRWIDRVIHAIVQFFAPRRVCCGPLADRRDL